MSLAGLMGKKLSTVQESTPKPFEPDTGLVGKFFLAPHGTGEYVTVFKAVRETIVDDVRYVYAVKLVYSKYYRTRLSKPIRIRVDSIMCICIANASRDYATSFAVAEVIP